MGILSQPNGMALKTFDVAHEIAKDHKSTMVFPFPMNMMEGLELVERPPGEAMEDLRLGDMALAGQLAKIENNPEVYEPIIKAVHAQEGKEGGGQALGKALGDI